MKAKETDSQAVHRLIALMIREVDSEIASLERRKVALVQFKKKYDEQ